MTTPYLHGNGKPCPACDKRREQAASISERMGRLIYCSTCGGSGRQPLTDAEIVRRTCIEARRLYWPQFDKRTANNA
ncbi:hypothetical protein [Nostoc phage Nsp-JY21]